MQVPLQFRAWREVGVGGREEAAGKGGCEDGVQEGVEKVAEEDFVDVEGEGV